MQIQVPRAGANRLETDINKVIYLIEPMTESFQETVGRLSAALNDQHIDSDMFWTAVKLIRQRYRLCDSATGAVL
jgi:hypothetical protein